jgi:maltose/maltodextrin transport system permease protein
MATETEAATQTTAGLRVGALGRSSARKPAPTALQRALRWAATALGVALVLAAVLRVHAAGESLLASTLLLLLAAAAWVYGSRTAHAARYLFPGIAAALLFVVFPMLYTVGIGFTNYSSANLLTRPQAEAYLQGESAHKPGSARPFQLLREGAGWRLHLRAGEGREALQMASVLPNEAAGPGVPAGGEMALQSAPAAPQTGAWATVRETVALLPVLRALRLRAPGGEWLTVTSLREVAQVQPLFRQGAAGELTDQLTGTLYRADDSTGFFTSPQGDRLTPGYRVSVGWAHYQRMLTQAQFREPFISVLVWTVAFAALSVVGAAGLGLVLAVLLNWEALQLKGFYRVLLFLPYAVPGFISILVFKGLFNQNLGEVNLILGQLFGIRPAWFSDPWLARLMLVLVNIWLGFPYMMVLCTGLIKSIPADLYEASAVAGASAWVNFSAITLPLIAKPLTPLLISAFAFNFNNFVLVKLLTDGRPDQLDATLPVGTTDILVSYTGRIAFQDSGQQFGLASAISTVIFLIVAAITLVQMRWTRVAQDTARN